MGIHNGDKGMHVDFVAVGNALLDLVAGVGDGFLASLDIRPGGFRHVDAGMLERVENALPQWDGTAREVRGFSAPLGESPPASLGASVAERPVSSAGGGAAVAARVAAALGCNAAFRGCLGNDGRGRAYSADLAAAGVTDASVRTEELPTGLFCALYDRTGGKTVLVSPLAARLLPGFGIPGQLFRAGGILHIDGLMAGDPAFLRGLAARGKAAGMTVSLDLSTPGNARENGSILLETARESCRLVFCNEDEFLAIGGAVTPVRGGSGSDGDGYTAVPPQVVATSPAGTPKGTDTPQAAASTQATARPQQQVSPAWVVKLGPRGAIFVDGVRSCHVSGKRVEAVDDTGAGDAFAAAFLTGWTRGLPPRRCIAMGNAAGAVMVRNRGSRFDPGQMRESVQNAAKGP